MIVKLEVFLAEEQHLALPAARENMRRTLARVRAVVAVRRAATIHTGARLLKILAFSVTRVKPPLMLDLPFAWSVMPASSVASRAARFASRAMRGNRAVWDRESAAGCFSKT